MSEIPEVVIIFLTWMAGLAAYFAVTGRLINRPQPGGVQVLTVGFIVVGGLLVWIPVIPFLLGIGFHMTAG